MLHIPILRAGKPSTSLDVQVVSHIQTGQPLVRVSQANRGLVAVDLNAAGANKRALEKLSVAELVAITREGARLFMEAELPVGDDGASQTPQQYVEILSATSGLPHVMCRRNMQKIQTVLSQMGRIIHGLTRGLPVDVMDSGRGEQAGVCVSYSRTTTSLGAVLPSNSPGVNSIWLPAVALKVPVFIKPGRDEPWTPVRIIQALIAAGYPREALGLYPTDHEGADAILAGCGRAILFGDDATTSRYTGNANIQLHGTGRSKIILAGDVIGRWQDYLDVLMTSIVDNGGRSCINASCIIVPANADAIADALGRRLADIEPRPVDDEDAELAAFVNPVSAQHVDSAIERGLQTPQATDVTAQYRNAARLSEFDGRTYLRPTIVRCRSFDHPLANTEFLFPFAGVVQMSVDEAVGRIGPTLACTVVTEDEQIISSFQSCPDIDRLNIGPIPTTHVDWQQPHEGNLFDFLYRRRAIQMSTG